MLYEIKHRYTGAVLFSLECGSLKLCVEAAVSARANLAGAYLAGANLADANLAGAYLAGAYLAGANLAGANLAGAYLAGAYLARANLAGAYLADANLADAYLARAYLAGANLAGANLAGANLADAILAGANLAGANLAGAWIIDGGQDNRGFRFMAGQAKDGSIQYRAGCKTWGSIDEARAYYGPNYAGRGDVAECLARLELLRGIAEARWPQNKAEAA